MMHVWVAGLLVTLLGGGPLELGPAAVSRALAVTDEPVEITARLKNGSAVMVTGLTADLVLPAGWRSDPVQVRIPALAPFTEHLLRFVAAPVGAARGDAKIVVSGAGAPISARFRLTSCNPLPVWTARYAMTRQAVGEMAEDGTIYVTTGATAIFLPRCGIGRGPGLVYAQHNGSWERLATFPAMGRVVYVDAGEAPRTGMAEEHWVCPRDYTIPPYDPRSEYILTLLERWEDRRGRRWTAKAFLAPTTEPNVVKYTQLVYCSRAAELLRYEGPMLSVGDGTFGTARRGYLLPAPAPDLPASGPVVVRTGQVDQGVLAVEAPGQGVLGLLWDPTQLWAAGKAWPHGLLASPNAVYGQPNHYLSLLVPHFDEDQPAAAPYPRRAYHLAAGKPVVLRTELYVAPGGNANDVTNAWHERRAELARPLETAAP